MGRLGVAIEEALKEYGGGKVRTVDEPQYAGSNGAHKIALDMPEEYWKEFDTTDQISASTSSPAAEQTAETAPRVTAKQTVEAEPQV